MTGPPPAVAAIRAAVRVDLAGVAPGDLVLVACSGGPDSVALAAATAFVAPRIAVRAGAVVVDHGLQAGSGPVAEEAAALCRRLGLDPVVIVTLDGVDAVAGGGGAVAHGGPEAAARTARYAALERQAVDVGARAVLVGHTRDDQAETVLLRLSRGSGARSLAGMPARRGLLRRPLLTITREQTETACTALGLQVWHDPTNAAPAGGAAGVPLRSQVRSRILPVLEDVLGPGVRASLARTAELLRDDADALDALATATLATVMLDQGAMDPAGSDQPVAMAASGSPVALDVARLATALPAIRRRALRLAAVRAGASDGDLARSHVLALDALVTAWRGQGPVDLPGGVRGARRCGTLVLAPGEIEEH